MQVFFSSDKELVDAVEEIYSDLNNNLTVLGWDDQANLPHNFTSFKQPFDEAPSEDPDKSMRKHIIETDTLCYIYTSGTTGKAHSGIMRL